MMFHISRMLKSFNIIMVSLLQLRNTHNSVHQGIAAAEPQVSNSARKRVVKRVTKATRTR